MLQIFLLCFSFLTHASTIVERQNALLLDTLRSSEAVIRGTFQMDRSVNLFHENGFPSKDLTIPPSRDIGYMLTDNQISLFSQNGMVMNVAGVTFNLSDISFNERTGFSVSAKSSLWFNLGGNEVANEVRAELERRYGRKMRTAFLQLKQLRRQRSLNDAHVVMRNIMRIFEEQPNGQPDPFRNVTIRGTVTATVTARRSANLDFGEAQLQIRPGSSMTGTTDFTLRQNQFRIRNIQLDIAQINVYPTHARPDGTIRVTGAHISLTEDGLNTIFDSPAEGEVMTIAMAVTWLTNVARTGTLATGIICPPNTRVQFIQDMISERVRPQLAAMIRQHRQQFLTAGVDAQILNALDG